MFNLQSSSPLLQATLSLCLLLLAATTTTHAADPLNQIIREQQWDATHVLLVQITSNGTATDIFESECGFDTYYETDAIVLGVNRTVDPDATAIGAITRGTVHKQCDTIEFKTWARQWKDTCEPDRYNDPGRKMDGTCGYIYLTPGMVATDPYVLVARGFGFEEVDVSICEEAIIPCLPKDQQQHNGDGNTGTVGTTGPGTDPSNGNTPNGAGSLSYGRLFVVGVFSTFAMWM